MSSSGLRIGMVYDDTIDRPGGVAVYVTALGRALSARGHHVEYLIGQSNQTNVDRQPVHSLARNISVRFNGNALSMPALTHGARLDEVVAHGRYDVLHVQVPYSPVMAGRLIRRVDPRCAVVGTYHVASERLAPQVGAAALRVLKLPTDWRFDQMIAVSRVAAEFARRWAGVHVDAVIPNPLPAIRATRHGSAPRADVVFVGRLVPRKGIRELVAAFQWLERQGTSATLAVLGDGPLRDPLLRSLIAGDSKNIQLHGVVSDGYKFAALSQAKVACFPSLFGESFGLVIGEAVAAGSEVVIAGDNPGYRELLGDSASLVDPRDTEQFARRIATLLEDAALRAKLGAQQRHVVHVSDLCSVADQVEDVYARALRARRRNSLIVTRSAVRGAA